MGQEGLHVDVMRKFRTAVLPIERLVLNNKWVRIPSAKRVKTSLDVQGPSTVHCTGLRLSLTLSQTSRIPGAKHVIS